MNRQECERLSEIQRKLNIYSAQVGVLFSALERHQLDETAAIEVVLQDLHYNLAEQSEMLEKMVEAAQAQHRAAHDAELASKEAQWREDRLANIPPAAVEAFNAVNAAYGIKSGEDVA